MTELLKDEDNNMTEINFKKPIESIELLFTSSKYFLTFSSLLLLNEVLLCYLIIKFVPYTEIDWSTYMQQVGLFLNGERNYSLLKGSTGPIVYPAGFLYFYSALYYITNEGKNIRLAQYVFAQIYVVTLGMVFVLYKRCGSLPPYALVLICLSKRLHSIYVLRLFNDGVAMLFFYAALLAWTSKRPNWSSGSILFSIALSIKMNLLLYLPAILYLFFTTLGPIQTIFQLSSMILVQISLAIPFLSSKESALIYFQASFNFSREFLWKWTVNWRWVGIEAFESKIFSQGLLVANIIVLILCGLNWSSREGGVLKILLKGLRKPNTGAVEGIPSPELILTTLFTSNLVGILFARSLHYQFYAWYSHQLVFLVWHTPYDILQRLALLAAVEYGWNVFPSTLNSSMGLTFANAFILCGVYYGAPTGFGNTRSKGRKSSIESKSKSQ